MVNIYRVNILEDRLRQLTEAVPGIMGTVIVSIEGFVVAAYPPSEQSSLASAIDMSSTSQVAAMAAALIALGEQTLGRLAQGQMERLLIEGGEGAIIVYPINQNAALAAMVDKNAKMGMVLVAIARAAAAFGDVLSGTELW
ncbi:MAG: roadblock/LC7 domain-containing protein [Chloroflexi bacterium]|nr:roadblock/LC7 domain-containing protein [Chloroflexota bacterium]